MTHSFEELGIAPSLLKAIAEMGFQTPTEVQGRVIPHIFRQEDLIVMSKTGSGKTAVYGLPLLQMIDATEPGPQALILTPTRELAVQVETNLNEMAKYQPHKVTAVYGQHNMDTEVQAIKRGVAILSGTPGRVLDHLRQKTIPTKHIRYLVIDEADRMLDMGFIDQVVRIIKFMPNDRVTLLFSATIPDEVNRMCRSYMKNASLIEIESVTKTVDAIDQAYYRVERNEKRTQLQRILTVEHPESCIIFCNTRAIVDRLQEFLTKKGYPTKGLHGDVPQNKRLRILQQFKDGEFPILVATDVAGRGIHIEDLSLVINYDVPIEKDNYVHRIGRTGRAGKGGKSLTFVTTDDILSLYAIEEHINAIIPEVPLPTDAEVSAARNDAQKWLSSTQAFAPESKQGAQPAKERQEKPKTKQKKEAPRTVSAEAVEQIESVPKKRKRKRKKKPANSAASEQLILQSQPELGHHQVSKEHSTQVVHHEKPEPAPKKSLFQRLFRR